MKKGKKIAIIVGLILIIVGYFGIKGFCLYAYNTSKFTQDKNNFIWDIKESFDNKSAVTIKKNTNSDNDYFYYDGLKIRNDFDKTENTEKVYKIKDTDILVTFKKNSIDYLVSLVKESSKTMGLNYDLTKDFEKNNINTDYKLYEYLFNNMNAKVSIFSSIHNLRKAMSINMSLLQISSTFNKFTLIDGDYDGYILQNNKAKDVVINHNNTSYFITIYSNEYSDEKLFDLLSTISFE